MQNYLDCMAWVLIVLWLKFNRTCYYYNKIIQFQWNFFSFLSFRAFQTNKFGIIKESEISKHDPEKWNRVYGVKERMKICTVTTHCHSQLFHITASRTFQPFAKNVIWLFSYISTMSLFLAKIENDTSIGSLLFWYKNIIEMKLDYPY